MEKIIKSGENSFQHFSDELEKVSRRLDKLQKSVDILDSDRQIFEDIQARLTAVEEQLKITRRHDVDVKKDIKEEINIIGDRVERKVEEKVGAIDDKIASKKTIRIKEKSKTFLQLIKEIFGNMRR